MSARPDYTLIPADELAKALANEVQACSDCAGGLGIYVEVDADGIWSWDPVVVHSTPCTAAIPRQRPHLRLVHSGEQS